MDICLLYTSNIGAKIGEGSMIDMGAVLGGRAEVGKHCHVGAGAVLAGVIEPPSACLLYTSRCV